MENKFIEIARSYSQKLNIGNFQSSDFFCSAKEECKPEQMEEVSKRLFHFCRQMVRADINNYLEENPDMQHKEEVIDADKNLLKPLSLEEQNTYDQIQDKTGLFHP